MENSAALSDQKYKYDSRAASVYEYFSKQHYHENGPFIKMTNHVVQCTKDIPTTNENPLVIADLASGHGEPAASIALALPDSIVYSTDLSESMLSFAQKRADDIPNMRTAIADMQDLQPLFQDETVDAVTCCYGIMFPPDKVRALNEVYRVLKPGGTYVVTCWVENPSQKFFQDLFGRITSDAVKGSSSVYKSMPLSEEGLLESMLHDAGFINIQSSLSQYPLDFTNDPDFHIAAVVAMDGEKLLDTVENGIERVKQLFPEVASRHLKVKEDGTLVADPSIYKCVVAQKPSNQ